MAKANYVKLMLVWAILVIGEAQSAFAHPVAQGAMSLEVTSDEVKLNAEVAYEEVFVENSFSTKPLDGEALWSRHGKYILDHLKITLNDVSISGQLVDIDHNSPEQKSHQMALYRYSFPIGGGDTPRTLTIAQNILNEFEFVPGNPWEATFLLTVKSGGTIVDQGFLLTRKSPFEIRFDKLSVGSQSKSKQLFLSYLQHGIEHILAGYDHLLFVSALVLAVVSIWDLIAIITAFTIAHTITLTLAVLGLVNVPSSIVEPAIALSIVIVAIQNILSPRLRRGWRRLIIAFFFGLFHGLGFAGGLLGAMQSMAGLDIGTAIVGFASGVELGHQIIVIPLYLALAGLRAYTTKGENGFDLSACVLRYGSACIALAGGYFLFAAIY